MKKTASALSKIAYAIAAVILAILSYNTAHYTFVHDFEDYSAAYLYEGPDSRLLNLLVLIFVIAFSYLLVRLIFSFSNTKKQQSLMVLYISAGLSLTTLVLGCIWVSKTYIPPFWDQAYCIEAADNFINSDYTKMSELYLKMYPQQLGLIFCESLFLRIWDFYGIFQYMNAIFVALIIFLSGRVSHEIFENPVAELFTVILTTAFTPLFYYVSFIYGDVFALCACFFVAWMLIRFIRKEKIVYGILAIVVSMVMVPVRENTLIFILATVIFLTVMAIRFKKVTPLIIAALIVVLPLITTRGIKSYYEDKSGVKLDNEVPSINWIVMGMRGTLEEGKGVGYYDGYNYYTWFVNGQDKKVAIEYSKEVMNEFFKSYKEDPIHAVKFYRYKVFEQWLEPTFDCIYMTVSDHETSWKEVDLLYNQNAVKRLNNYCDYFLTIAYVCAFFCVVYLFFKDKYAYGVYIATFFIGIFLFSIIWEAKGRYTLPGFVMLFVLSGAGVSFIHSACTSLYYRFAKKKEPKKESELNE